MKVRCHSLSRPFVRGIIAVYAAVSATSAASTARAAGVVGTGTAASCTDAALDTALAGGGLVTFDCGGPATIDISTGTGTKTITADTTIDGGGLITISGGDTVGVFAVSTGDFSPGVNFSVKSLTIANGNLGAAGGGIAINTGTLTVTDSTFSGNSGGGIYSQSGLVTITNSTFSGNSGGGIYSDRIGGELAVTNSTFVGSAIVIYGRLTVINSTFTGNSGISHPICDFKGCPGGLLRNTVIANNAGANCSGNITDGGHNLDSGASCGFSPANGSLSNTDPQLDPAGLQDNGGPTDTVALCTEAGVPAGCTAASPAIDAGDPCVCYPGPVNNLDQRQFVRMDTSHPQCSMGAYEPDAAACGGDCNVDGSVTVDELVTGVDIALGGAALDQCQAFDCNGDGRVSIDCLVRAVDSALAGCGSFFFAVCSGSG